MTFEAGMQLVFRLGDYGFALPVDELAEIHQAGADEIDRKNTDLPAGCLGVLPWRDRRLEVYPLDGLLGLPVREVGDDTAILVVCGSEGYWGLACGRLEGLHPGRDFRSHALPELLERETPLPFERLLEWHDEILHGCSAVTLETLRGSA